uniref:Uncharacterized protein n=1 Tax=Panagrolaimus sp. PS1159 TaxID=55785 RepID=A0AC35G4U2_9BILA
MDELIERTKEILTPQNVNNYDEVVYFGERFNGNVKCGSARTYNNGKYWIDEFGNYYLNEMDCIQTIGKLKAFNRIEKATDKGEKWISVQNVDDQTFLNLVLSNFESIEKDTVFSAFYHDLRAYPAYAVKTLTHIKCFFHVFMELERIMAENQLSWIGFLMYGVNFQILFSNFCYTDVSFYNNFNFDTFRNDIIDFTSVITPISYELCLAAMAFQIPPLEQLESQKGAIFRRVCFKNNADYRDICYKITIALVRYIRAECDEGIKSQIESDQVKNILFLDRCKIQKLQTGKTRVRRNGR